MALKFKSLNNDKALLEFENTVSFWNILKFLADTPYLKHYIVENYDGGNTLVPIEAWHEEGIMFKEVKKGIYFFPYESIGFVVNDSIDKVTLTMLDTYQEGMNYKDEAELVFSVSDTDHASLIINKDRIPGFIALYLLSLMKVGFDKSMIATLETALKSLNVLKIKKIDYMKSSLLIHPKGASFIIKILNDDDEISYNKLSYSNKKFKKDIIKEQDIKTPSQLKKKILAKNKYFPYVYYGLIALSVILAIVLFVFKQKLFISLALITIAIYISYRLVKKHAFKFLK